MPEKCWRCSRHWPPEPIRFPVQGTIELVALSDGPDSPEPRRYAENATIAMLWFTIHERRSPTNQLSMASLRALSSAV